MFWNSLFYPVVVILSVYYVESFDSTSQVDERNNNNNKFPIFGYVPEYRLNNFDYDGVFESGLTHLIFFSLEVDGTLSLPKALDRLPSKTDAHKARLAANTVDGKLILSFGGNARSQGFAEMTRKSSSRRKFLDALNKILIEYEFDGVDYNWEYPQSADEWKSWKELIKESKEILLKTKDSSMTNKENIVTFTMYLDANHFEVIRQFNMLEHADYLHCMAYDSRGKHSTYEFAKKGLNLTL